MKRVSYTYYVRVGYYEKEHKCLEWKFSSLKEQLLFLNKLYNLDLDYLLKISLRREINE